MRGARRRVAVRCPLCAARSAPRWLGLRRVRAGGGGEAGGCGRECGRARGARGCGALRAPPAPPPVGPASHSPAQLCSSGRPAPLLAWPVPPAPGALSSPVAPRYSLPPTLCFAALGALSDPVAPRIPSLSPPRSCPSSGAPLLFPSLLGTSMTCHRPGTTLLFFF